MTPGIISWIWFGGGLALTFAELLIPGTLVSFFGVSAMLVAGLRAIGLVESVPLSFGLWMGLSVVLVASLRNVVQRWSHPERSVGSTDEDMDAYGAEVEVVATVTDTGEGGRIRFHGTSWPARSVRGVLEPGLMVRIVHRDNLVWIVEPLGAALPDPETENHGS